MTFGEMLVRVGTLSPALGVTSVTWHWLLDDGRTTPWSAAAPNADVRWKAMALGAGSIIATGEGHTGEEALSQLLAALEKQAEGAFVA